jgi:diacylglycerol kinase family enzyme
MDMRITLIFNPIHGGRDITTKLAAIHSACGELGLDYELLFLGPKRPAEWAAERVQRDPPDRVWICGGDGTVTAVGAALMHTGIPIAILPGGTANAIARSVGVPYRLADAVRFAIQEVPRPFDAVKVNGRISLLTAGAGYDSAVMGTADTELKRKLGVLAYVYAGLKQLGATGETAFDLELDGAESQRVTGNCLLMANIGKLFGEFDLFPDAKPDDGRVDIAVLTLGDLNDLLSLSGHVLQGKVEAHPRSRFFSAARVKARFDKPLPTEVDGDLTGVTGEMEAEVVPGALLLVRSDTPKKGWQLPGWRARGAGSPPEIDK